MIKVFEAQNLPEAHLVCGLLQADGINAEVRGDTLFSTLGTGTDIPGVLPTIWVSRSEDAAKASDIVSKFNRGDIVALSNAPSWQCPKCQEVHEPQFSSCWKCGTQKPVPAQAS
jgi:hypothetical protein